MSTYGEIRGELFFKNRTDLDVGAVKTIQYYDVEVLEDFYEVSASDFSAELVESDGGCPMIHPKLASYSITFSGATVRNVHRLADNLFTTAIKGFLTYTSDDGNFGGGIQFIDKDGKKLEYYCDLFDFGNKYTKGFDYKEVPDDSDEDELQSYNDMKGDVEDDFHDAGALAYSRYAPNRHQAFLDEFMTRSNSD